ncbi:MAG: hypothetical protein QXK88_07760 [Desulfurococcaceae archaeon]
MFSPFFKIFIGYLSDNNFKHLPAIEESILAFTLIALGLQAYFSAFMLNITGEKT